TYSIAPTRTGSNPLGTYTLSNTPAPTYESTVGPIGGSGSWKFVSTSSGSVRFRTTSTNEWLGVNDTDYTQGFWFSVGSIPALTTSGSAPTAATIYALLPVTGIGFNVSIAPSNTTATQGGVSLAGKILIQYESTSYVIGPTYEANKWYYIATRRIGSTIETYINGSLVQTQTIAPSATVTSMSFGAISNPTTTSDTNFWVSNFHQSTSSILNATAIAEIWAVGSSINKTITETPATASALMTDPTIAVQNGNHTEITTSIPVSAEFPSNIGIVAQANINNVITEVLTASTIFGDNITISAGTDSSYSATQFEASALMVQPIETRGPLLASAVMGNHIGSVSASYFALVKNLNPYLFINNGETAANIINYGYQTVTFTKGTGLSTLQDAGNPLNLIGSGKSWKGSDSSADPDWLKITAPSTSESFDNILGTGEFSIEFWIKTPSWFAPANGANYTFIRDESINFYYGHKETYYNTYLPPSLNIVIKNSNSG
ncbi:hypothetical protein EB001_25285, partial [bacterium]|nr:hypothetical protein [bacterium]